MMQGERVMPRPKKYRKVCCLPEINLFGPIIQMNNQKSIIVMTVEEYETIRLIDLEGLTQEECAKKMNVARTTVQSIYTIARTKLADCLVNGKILSIDGGDYKLCDSAEISCGRGNCSKHGCRYGMNHFVR